MITKVELMERAKEFELRPDVVEKDYILGWLLKGIQSHPTTHSLWVFKGGTSLKKCYFETYRFSEDLDFTVNEGGDLDPDLLVNLIQEITNWVSEESGIEFPPHLIQSDPHRMAPDGEPLSVRMKVGYIGPLGQRQKDSIPKVKFDLTVHEIIVLEPILREVIHPYSDKPSDGVQARCYAYEEVFAEKIRALAERGSPRDLYDVVHLFRHKSLVSNKSLLVSTLEEKCRFKELGVPTLLTIQDQAPQEELKTQWEQMLSHQLPHLPPFESFWEGLLEFFSWLHQEGKVIQPLDSYVTPQQEESWIPSDYAHIIDSSFMRKIQFAAANRICIRLKYKERFRTVEPLSFRQDRTTGNKLFYGFERDENTVKSYNLNRIEDVQVTTEAYIPKYEIEIPAQGAIYIPLTTFAPRRRGRRPI